MNYFPKSFLVADYSLEIRGLHILAGGTYSLNMFLFWKKQNKPKARRD